MALLHRATLVPTKGDLVAAWLPSRPWAPPGPIREGTSYRLDDPAGEVGMEGFLLTDDSGVTVHVPLTYRGGPVAGAEAHLLGTMEHSVLGTRWVYDGGADPVWLEVVARTIATAGVGAEEWVQTADGRERREQAVRVRGDGCDPETFLDMGFPTAPRPHDTATTTTVAGDGIDLVVVRRIGADPRCEGRLLASWGAVPDERVLAGLRRR